MKRGREEHHDNDRAHKRHQAKEAKKAAKAREKQKQKLRIEWNKQSAAFDRAFKLWNEQITDIRQRHINRYTQCLTEAGHQELHRAGNELLANGLLARSAHQMRRVVEGGRLQRRICGRTMMSGVVLRYYRPSDSDNVWDPSGARPTKEEETKLATIVLTSLRANVCAGSVARALRITNDDLTRCTFINLMIGHSWPCGTIVPHENGDWRWHRQFAGERLDAIRAHMNTSLPHVLITLITDYFGADNGYVGDTVIGRHAHARAL